LHPQFAEHSSEICHCNYAQDKSQFLPWELPPANLVFAEMVKRGVPIFCYLPIFVKDQSVQYYARSFSILLRLVARIHSPRAIKVIRAKSQRAEVIVTRADWQTAFVTSVVNTDARKPLAFGGRGGATKSRYERSLGGLGHAPPRASQIACVIVDCATR
jgi:hypothetical protein